MFSNNDVYCDAYSNQDAEDGYSNDIIYEEGKQSDEKNNEGYLIFDSNMIVNIQTDEQKVPKEQPGSHQKSRYHDHISHKKTNHRKIEDQFLIDPNTMVQTIPRCNGPMLLDEQSKYNNTEITIVAAYEETKDTHDESRFLAPGGGEIYVKHGHDVKYTSKFNEIRGLHLGNGFIKQYSYQSWGDNFSLSLWNDTVILMQSYPNIF